MLRRLLPWIGLALAALPMVVPAAPLHHKISAELAPGTHSIRVTDELSLPPAGGPLEFTLHAGLTPRAEGGLLVRLGTGEEAVPLERFRLEPAAGARRVTLHYGGVIHHPLQNWGEGIGQGGETTPGFIGAEGAVLNGASAWYPRFTAWPRMAFEMTVAVPAGWEAISQGARAERSGRVHWSETSPQEEIYLLAGPFTRYSGRNRPTSMVYLRTPDPALAATYLAATDRYLNLYSDLLGSYAYAKFALVENFWETGYGMPSFTLLGPRVIRLPFLLESSYPHEVLHNWWGNGVFVDAAGGNWSEGLTAYLADHLIKEQAGRGAEYRRDQLQAYASYVSSSRDFPLARFGERHSGASQAVGYGKGMMFFHMLRREMGDERFIAGLRRFYARRQFTTAGFEDLRADLEVASGMKLGPLFRQWLDRPGAPALALADARFTETAVSVTLEQSQQDAPFVIKVPLVVGLADGRSIEREVQMDQRRVASRLDVPGRPVCVAVDPGFDLFRRVLPGELPRSLGAVFGGERLLIVLPERAPAPLRDAYGRLASSWAAAQAGIEVKHDGELSVLPADRPALLLGWENRHLQAISGAPTRSDAQTLTFEQRSWSRRNHSFVVAGRQRGQAVAWLATDDAAALPALGRKVPHYGKFSYLAFEGAAAENRLKGQWAVEDSPLQRRIGEGSCAPAPGRALARLK